MKTNCLSFLTAILLLSGQSFGSSELSAQTRDNQKPDPVKLQNPISVAYLKKNLSKLIIEDNIEILEDTKRTINCQ